MAATASRRHRHLRAWGKDPVVTWSGQEARAPADARASLHRAQALNVRFSDQVPPQWDLAIDAMLGLGAGRPLEGVLGAMAAAVMAAAGDRPVLAVDLPSGLNADTGNGSAVRATHTLSLLTLKPGLFTAAGRDAAGEIWFDDLGCGGSVIGAKRAAGRRTAARARGRTHRTRAATATWP